MNKGQGTRAQGQGEGGAKGPRDQGIGAMWRFSQSRRYAADRGHSPRLVGFGYIFRCESRRHHDFAYRCTTKPQRPEADWVFYVDGGGGGGNGRDRRRGGDVDSPAAAIRLVAEPDHRFHFERSASIAPRRQTDRRAVRAGQANGDRPERSGAGTGGFERYAKTCGR